MDKMEKLILITNDDSVNAKGINSLVEADQEPVVVEVKEDEKPKKPKKMAKTEKKKVKDSE